MHATIFVFKEIVYQGQLMYQHFREAEENEEGHIVPDELLDEAAHWERLAFD